MALSERGENGSYGHVTRILEIPIGFAHRGARALALDNTLDAFRLAVEMGATGLESDVWVSNDGHAVLDHDGIVGGWLRRRPIGTVLRHRLPEHVPSLDELYVTCGTDRPVSLDVKDPAALGAVLAAADAAAPGTGSGSAIPTSTSWRTGGSTPRGYGSWRRPSSGPSRTAPSGAPGALPARSGSTR